MRGVQEQREGDARTEGPDAARGQAQHEVAQRHEEDAGQDAGVHVALPRIACRRGVQEAQRQEDRVPR